MSEFQSMRYTDRRLNGSSREQMESRKRTWHQSTLDGVVARRGDLGGTGEVARHCVLHPNSCQTSLSAPSCARSPKATANMTAGGEESVHGSLPSSSPSLLSDSSGSIIIRDSSTACAPFPSPPIFWASTDDDSRQADFGGLPASTLADLPDKLSVMIRQDSFAYSCEDYLSPTFRRRQLLEQAPPKTRASSVASSPDSVAGIYVENTVNEMNEDWRAKMCEWSYQVIDHYGFDRETVSVAFSFLDRYVARRGARCMRTFQLIAMTCVFLACKLHSDSTAGRGVDRIELSVESLINLSRGFFTAEHIEAMELSILRELSWRVHPPTPATFVKHLAILVPPGSCMSSIRKEIEESAIFFAELSVLDYSFVPRSKSSVAIAALLNAMDGIEECYLSAQSRRDFMQAVVRVTGLNPGAEEVKECRHKLHSMHMASTFQQPACEVTA